MIEKLENAGLPGYYTRLKPASSSKLADTTEALASYCGASHLRLKFNDIAALESSLDSERKTVLHLLAPELHDVGSARRQKMQQYRECYLWPSPLLTAKVLLQMNLSHSGYLQ